jgi:hypothetical protein
MSGFCLAPGAEFLGELPDALRAAFVCLFVCSWKITGAVVDHP